MNLVNLFDNYYPFRDYYCNNKKTTNKKRRPLTTLYIRVNNECNGKCKFCLNCNNKTTEKINLNKLKFIYKYLMNKKLIGFVTITGGEPMLNPQYINNIINTLVEVNKDVIISLSTNGTNLEKILEFDNLNNIKHIHVSRHHYLDKENDKVFGFKTISTQKLKELQNKLKNIIINTVSIKGYIDTDAELEKMINYTKALQIERLHFVSLINYNNYCKFNYVDINDIFKKLENQNKITRLDDLYREKYCECHYFTYKDTGVNDFIIMGRLTHHNTCPYIEQLVYTNDNKLLTGFDSDKIIYE